nr:MAG TPA: hypothetical protein [Caudoviricetes sp.]
MGCCEALRLAPAASRACRCVCGVGAWCRRTGVR